jgi:leucyl aminopeptidase
MRVSILTRSVTEVEADALVVNLFEGVRQPGGATGAVDAALGGQIRRLIESGEIRGKLNEVTIIHTDGRLPAARVAVAGLGKQEEFNLESIYKAVGSAARLLQSRGCKKIATILHGAGAGNVDAERSAEAVVEAVSIATYDPGAYKTVEPAPAPIEELLLVERDASRAARARRGARVGEVVADAVASTRKLVNEPANDLTPRRMAEEARRLANLHGLDIEIFEQPELKRRGFGGIVAVGKGSEETPVLIAMRCLSRRRGPLVALVGKGMMFDSGGISIKPSEGMELMKGDMAGAAAVLGAIDAACRLKLKVNLLAVMPCAENLPSGRASKPGDVIKTLSGKTVEIANTDAEGRLILADAFAYARSQGATHIVDLATLTGACVVALGNITSGLMSNDEDFMEKVRLAAARAGEKVWPLPLFPEYREQNKSLIADVKNTGGRPAGAITAAAFLQEFVDNTPWAHLDIAGTYWNEKDVPYMAKGPTGVGVRTLVEFIRLMAGQ